MHIARKTINFFKARKIFVVIGLIVTSIFLFSQCGSESSALKEDYRGPAYVGSTQCKNCHQQIAESHFHSAHARTSSDSMLPIVEQAFTAGKNIFKFNDESSVIMEKANGQYYQSYYENGRKAMTQPFDIIVGSGRKAQTYLYYDNKGNLLQLPISFYMPEQTWANSPGFPADHAKFDRFVPSNCLCCHSSFISVKQTYQGVNLQEHFDKGRIVYGIDCERCHGPAAEHVNFFTKNPNGKEPKPMTKIASLTRAQKIDMCALCHSGEKDVQQSLFRFKPGDNLSDFYLPDFPRVDTANLDVHGNQTQLMMVSKCFQQSNQLTCISCHDVHVKERDNLVVFSNRCMNCHKDVKHGFLKDADESFKNTIQTNCVDCHMPLKESSSIRLLTNQNTKASPDYIRNHLIAVYEKETRKFLASKAAASHFLPQ